MADYTPITTTQTDPGRPGTSQLFKALEENPRAMMEGASGAPRLQLAAFQEVEAGGVIKLFNDSVQDVATSSSYTTAVDFNIMQNGSIRVTFRHRQVGGGASEARVLLGATVINDWSTSSASFQSRSVDVTVVPGDRIRIQHRNIAVGNSEMDNRRIQTSGAYVLPFNTTSFTDINV